MANSNDFSTTVLKARIALLATAIGGPDYNSNLDPPPYKLGDDCLACLKDLKRWFRLVDENQNRWDVAMAAAEYRILQDDLLPILIDWENKSYLAHKLDKHSGNKEYHDNIALLCIQLLVLMTWPLVLTDQSTARQVAVYSELKKHQLAYKKHILMIEKGKVLKAIIRLALKVIKVDRIERKPRDNLILRLILNLFRNVIAIEPGELNVTKKKQLSAKGITSVDMLPPSISMDDISLNAVISAFHKNKVFGLLLTLSSSLSTEFEQDYINLPLMEIMFYLTKDIAPQSLFIQKHEERNNVEVSAAGAELLNLLDKENTLKKNVIKNTSTRHSRFGALLSIQTPDSGRLTISGGGQNLLDDTTALKKLDSRKKWNKRSMQARDDVVVEGLPNSLLNSTTKSSFFQNSTMITFSKFIDDFISSSFNSLLHSVTNHFTTDQDQMSTLEQTEYLLFFSWFVKYQREKCANASFDINSVDSALKETSLILMSTLLRTSYELKNWSVVHAGMVAFRELLLLTSFVKDDENGEEIEFILSRLFRDEILQLLTSLPKSAFRHSLPYMKGCVELVHAVLGTLEQYAEGDSLMIAKKTRRRQNLTISESEVTQLMNSEGLGRDEALDILDPAFQTVKFNFMKVLKRYCVESTIDTYINYLHRFRELEDTEIKKAMVFLHRVFVQASEESLLFRIDLLVLLRDMLAPDGISRKARVRKHVEQFSNYFLHRLKKRLKTSPSWFVGLLFPLCYGNEVGYFQKYGEINPNKDNKYYAALPSRFKRIEDEEQLPASALKDMKYGILVSTLIDDGKNEILDELIRHIQLALDHFRSWLAINIQRARETDNPPDEIFELPNNNESQPLVFDKDFRALLEIIGYYIPSNVDDSCKLRGTVDMNSLSESLDLVKKHVSTPFQTPNGLPSSSYLTRPRNVIDEKNGDDDWQVDNHDNSDSANNQDGRNLFVTDDDLYFQELEDGVNDTSPSEGIGKGLARPKKKSSGKLKKSKKRRKNLIPNKQNNDQPQETTKHHKNVLSKDFISDSENEDDFINPLFFENEMYMRWLLDKYRGQLSEEKFKLFAKFSSERIANNGVLKNDYSELFGGSIPNSEVLHHSETLDNSPDRTLLSLSRRVAGEMGKASGEALSEAENTDLSDSEASRSNSPKGISKSSAPSSTNSETRASVSSLLEDENSEETTLRGRKRKLLIEDDEDDE